MNLALASTTRSIVAQWENDGKIKEADALLQRALNEIQAERETAELKDFQSNFRKRHPDVQAEQKVENRRERKAIKVFSWDRAKDAVGNPAVSHFRRLILNDTVQAIVYSDSSSLKSTRFGIIRLFPEMKPFSSQLFPFPTRFEQNAYGYETLQYERNGPAIASDKDDIYIGVPQGGIIVQYGNGRSKIMNEETGLASETILNLDILDGKLYAIVGDYKENSGLMEVDPKSGSSNILYSTKYKDAEGELNGKSVRGIAADATRHGLWILSQSSQTAMKILYFYNPNNQEFKKVSDRQLFGNNIVSSNFLKKFDETLLISSLSYFAKFDIKSEAVTQLLAKQTSSSHAKWFKYLDWNKNPDRFILIDGDLLCHNGSELIFFHEGEKEPEYLQSYLRADSSSSPIIRDIVLTKKGLWVLTDDALYLIPEIAEQKPGNMLS
jgi:hypothetical protein